MGIKEVLRRIWLFSASKIKSSESGSKQPTQLIVKLNSSLWHIIVTIVFAQWQIKTINLNCLIFCAISLEGFVKTKYNSLNLSLKKWC